MNRASKEILKTIKRFNVVLFTYLVLLTVAYLSLKWNKNPTFSHYLFIWLGITSFLWTIWEHKNLAINKIYFRFLFVSFLFLSIGKFLKKIGLIAVSDSFLLGINMMIYFLLFQKTLRIVFLKIYNSEPELEKSSSKIRNVGYTLILMIMTWMFSIFFKI